MARYNIRSAKPDDIDEIIALCAEHAVLEKAAFDPRGKAERLAHHLFGTAPRAHCLVLEGTDGRLLGYATYALEFSTWDAEFFFHVDCLYLRPEARNQGVGWLFGKRIASEMVASGVGSMQFQTPPFNSPAIRIYEAMGATRKDKVRFYANREDALRFIKKGYRPSRSDATGRENVDVTPPAAKRQNAL